MREMCIRDRYEILAKEMIKRDREGRGFTFYHYMIDLTGGPCIYKRISGCGSGTEYMSVTLSLIHISADGSGEAPADSMEYDTD